jgi:hypothetical protein
VRPKPIFAAAVSFPSLDPERSPRPSLLLPPFKELDSSLISENPTNRLERHHHANPKNLTSTFSSFVTRSGASAAPRPDRHERRNQADEHVVGFPEQLSVPTAGRGDPRRSIPARPVSQRLRVFLSEFSPHPTCLHEPPQIVRLIGHHPPFCRMTFFHAFRESVWNGSTIVSLQAGESTPGRAGGSQPMVSSPNTSRASRPRWAGSMSSGTVCPVVR